MNRTALGLATVSVALVAPAARAQAVDPAIQKLLADTAAAYRALDTVAMTVEMVGGQGGPTTCLLTLQRPNKLAVTLLRGDVVRHIVADGEAICSYSSADKTKYVKQPGTTLIEALGAVPSSPGPTLELLTTLLASPIAEKRFFPDRPQSVTKEADETIDGVPCDVLAATSGNNRQAYAIGKADHLLRRVTAGRPGNPPRFTATFTKIDPKPTLDDSTLRFAPTAAMSQAPAPKSARPYDIRLQPGVEPLPLVGVDMNGKPVSYADYKGKVLLVDFWATWSDLWWEDYDAKLAAYKKLKDRGFDMLGISLDRGQDKAYVEEAIRDSEMSWRQIFEGKYRESANAVNYGLKNIPFNLLIGKDGKIVAVNVRGADLAAAVEEALK